MAKNKRFIVTYEITVDGVTTNGFASKLIDDAIRAMVMALDIQYKQVEVTIVKEELQ